MPDLPGLGFGSIPQWATFLLVTLAFIKWVVPWHNDELRKLRKEVKDCEEECRNRLHKLESDLWGEKRQRVAEQISLINVIIKNADAPELRTMLQMLESVQAHLQNSRALEAEGEAEC